MVGALIDPVLWTLTMVTWLSGVSICASPNLDIHGVKFDCKLMHLRKPCAWYSSRVSQRIGIWCLCGQLCLTLWLLCICPPNHWVLLSYVGVCCWMTQHLERQVYSVARVCQNQSFLSLCHRRLVTALCMLYVFNSNSNHCLFRELPSASAGVRQTQAEAAAHPLELKGSIKVMNIPICNVFPAGSGSYVE